MTHYVVGFLFKGLTDAVPQVALVAKQRPAWQSGKLNGIGGKIEQCDVGTIEERAETPLAAMVREFEEETSVLIAADRWRAFALLRHSGHVIHFFTATSGPEDAALQTMDEPIGWYSISAVLRIPNVGIIGNLRWLIPLALDEDQVRIEAWDNSTPWLKVPDFLRKTVDTHIFEATMGEPEKCRHCPRPRTEHETAADRRLKNNGLAARAGYDSAAKRNRMFGTRVRSDDVPR